MTYQAKSKSCFRQGRCTRRRRNGILCDMKRNSDKHIFRIWVHLRLSYASGRDLLYGISRWARANAHWRIHLHPFAGDAAARPFPASGDFDGIITSEPLADRAACSDIPLVVIGTREKWLGRRMASLAFVRNDDKDIGRLGAKTLSRTTKFASFGFVGTNTPYYCSTLRKEGFMAEIGRKAHAYGRPGIEDGSIEDIAELGGWLNSLPKPAAVMAVHDLRATHVLSAARTRGIKVPEELAVIGVDNDELLCEFTEPNLTSIEPDHVKEGALAASALAALLSAKPSARSRHTKTYRSTKKKIVERTSTRKPPSAALVAKEARSYILRNATKGCRASDVAAYLRVSRRLCDLRYREVFGKTVLDEILDVRFAAVKRRLAETKAPVGDVATASGFKCASHAMRLFRRRFGMTMLEYRAASPSRDS